MTPRPATRIVRNAITLAMAVALCAWSMEIPIDSSWQVAGAINITLAATLLCGFLTAELLAHLGIPKITGYILAGVVAGPHVTQFLDVDTVEKLQLINEIALSFIALHAGAALDRTLLSGRSLALGLNLAFQCLLVPLIVFGAIMVTAPFFAFTAQITQAQLLALALLSGIIAIARSPSSAMAIITECRARGPFTETALGITVAMDVLVIVLFTAALALLSPLLDGSRATGWHQAGVLGLELAGSLTMGALLGMGINAFYKRVGKDHALFLLFIAFTVTRLSVLTGHQLSAFTALHLSLEPLLICIAAGFVVRNATPFGEELEGDLMRLSLPIYVLFFSVAGASLDLGALAICWPLALVLATSRAAGLAISTRLAGRMANLPAPERRLAWMAHLTQAGVAIGLTQIIARKDPLTASYLTTLTLAVITINQFIGPVAFKRALVLTGEEGKDRR
ncbi:cation:proton antiporter [Desulfoluna butyratoxydans]|uniref:Cation/h+ exchanger n=1 Tax=Desulfoluna butyratoxydans TaxID=231438 RepID=A0A4U8YKC9_9BACT|nr:cation:proton antiporter [Desulfoluna butyratoxydans]VFQ44121.1 cation/h+ exchanger [Desulfoluna butyratoxydans]